MIKGRKNCWDEIISFGNKNSTSKIIWIHAASLGEFEQGRPIIEEIKKLNPEFKILLTFFSPSGYEFQKNYLLVDKVTYIPFDFPSNAKKFISLIKPHLAIFIKYEFWINYLNQLRNHQIPTYLISAVFHSQQPFFKWYGGIFRSALANYEYIFVQDKSSAALLKSLKHNQHIISGDTRYDRVLSICKNPTSFSGIEDFSKNTFSIIAGSSYETEEICLLQLYKKLRGIRENLKLILVPHHINKANSNRIVTVCKELGITYSIYSENINLESEILIIDTMGMLSSVYSYGKLAVVGGGFNDGIHSILEPAAFGLPIIFGPNYQKFNEAIELMQLESAFCCKDSKDFESVISMLLCDNEKLIRISEKTKKFMLEKSGATQKIIEQIRFKN